MTSRSRPRSGNIWYCPRGTDNGKKMKKNNKRRLLIDNGRQHGWVYCIKHKDFYTNKLLTLLCKYRDYDVMVIWIKYLKIKEYTIACYLLRIQKIGVKGSS